MAWMCKGRKKGKKEIVRKTGRGRGRKDNM